MSKRYVGFIAILAAALLLYPPIVFSVIDKSYENDLKYGSPSVRIKTVESIGRSGNPEYVEMLLSYSKDAEIDVRVAIARSLLRLNAKEYTDRIIDLLDDASPEVCAELRKTLVGIGRTEVFKKKLTGHPNPDVRKQIAIIFGETKDPAAVDVLLKALKDTDFVRFAAVKSLGQVGDKSVSAPLTNALKDPLGEIRVQAAKALTNLKIYSSVPDILNLLVDLDSTVRGNTERVLDGFVSDDTVLYFVQAVMKDRRTPVRIYATRAIGLLGSKSVAVVLFEALKDKDPSVRQEAIKSLEKIIDGTMVFNLCLSLNEKDINVRNYAVKTLERLKDPRAVPFLIDRLKKEKDQELRTLIQDTIIGISDISIVDFLAKALYDKTLVVRITAVRAIEKLKPPEILTELSDLLSREKDIELKYAIISTVKAFNNKSALPGLHVSLRKEKNLEIKLEIINVLKELKDYSSIPVALESLKYGDETIRMESEYLLEQLADMQSIDFFLEAAGDQSIVVRGFAMKVLKKFPVAKVLPVVIAGLGDSDPFIRKDAVYILGVIADKSTIPELTRMLKDRDEDIRIETVSALANMGFPRDVLPYMEICLVDKSATVRLEAVKFIHENGDRAFVEGFSNALKKESEVTVKEEIIKGLQKMKDPAAIGALKRSLKDMEPSVRKSAASALGDIGDPVIIPDLKKVFYNDYSSEVRAETMVALAKLDVKDMIPEFMGKVSDVTDITISSVAKRSLDILLDESNTSYLIGCLQSEHRSIRNYSYSVLKRMPRTGELPVDGLFKLLKKARGEIRQQAMELIDSMIDNKLLPDFLDLLKTSDDPQLKQWAIKHLGEFKDESVVSQMSDAVRDRDENMRKEAVRALGKIGGRRAIEILQHVAEKDESPAVRYLAREMLKTKK
ncbi:MAG: HEAT repeat domain-containing protein [Elusimicrobia bacterium]|nr:HEAT repeat domain-containing protein [Elusimicrobiota bacterium]